MGKKYTAVHCDIINWDVSALDKHIFEKKKINRFKNGVLVYNKKGSVLYCGKKNGIPKHIKNRIEKNIVYKNRIMLPGLIDLHIHLPQYAAMGADGYPLLPWLKNYIFPLEKNLNPKKTEITSKVFFKTLIDQGTTTAVIYGPAYHSSMNTAFEQAEKSGLRTYMGQTLMDRNSFRKEGKNKLKDVLIEESKEQIQHWHGKNELLNYVITPRFALSCTAELMKKAARLSEKYDLFVQTHLSENKDEIKTALKLFPDSSSYADIYENFGLMHHKSLFAHCIHLSRKEKELLKKRKSSIVYCPSSNIFLKSGILNIENINNITTGLGSDIAGGYDSSMLETIKAAKISNKVLNIYNSSKNNLSAIDAFFLASAASGRILQNNIGHLNKGGKADFIIVNPEKVNSLQKYFPEDFSENIEDILSRIIYAGARNFIEKVYISGKRRK